MELKKDHEFWRDLKYLSQNERAVDFAVGGFRNETFLVFQSVNNIIYLCDFIDMYHFNSRKKFVTN